MLDETEPLAGLLRKCLLLGAETGSATLRQWARSELYGYEGDGEVPNYRKLRGLPISMDSVSGNTWHQGRIIDRFDLPRQAVEHVPGEISFRQPVEELERLSMKDNLSFKSPGLTYAQMVWNDSLPSYQQVASLQHVMPGSAIAGMLGQVRTRLVDLVADLTSDTPLSELPKKAQVDAAVTDRIGDIYNTTIHAIEGPVGIGKKARIISEGLSVEAALNLLAEVQHTATADVAGPERAELLDAVAQLRAAITHESPDAGDVVKKAGKLRKVADKLGVASVSAAVGGAAQAIAELAVAGTLG
jgi:hypothetical protein